MQRRYQRSGLPLHTADLRHAVPYFTKVGNNLFLPLEGYRTLEDAVEAATSFARLWPGIEIRFTKKVS